MEPSTQRVRKHKHKDKSEEAELEQEHSQHTGRFMKRGEDPTVETKVRGQGSSSVGANRLG